MGDAQRSKPVEGHRDRPRQTFGNRRKRRIWGLRIFAAFLFAFFYFLYARITGNGDDWLLDVAGTDSPAGIIIHAFYSTTSLVSAALAILGAAFFICMVHLSQPLNQLYGRFFEEFDDETFQRVTAPKAFDPLRGSLVNDGRDMALPWILELEGSRKVAYEALLDFARSGTQRTKAEGGFLGRMGSTKPAVPFSWVLVTGESGSGKSRLVVEVARALGRRAELGDSKSVARFWSIFGRRVWGSQLVLDFAVPIKANLKTWLSLQVRRGAPVDSDAWDTGWLQSADFEEQNGSPSNVYSWSKRVRSLSRWSKASSGWDPRRPTFLILDDPVFTDAERVLRFFDEKADLVHPVRLVIVNQSVPSELHLDRSTGRWSPKREDFDLPTPAAEPIHLGADARFVEDDIKVLAQRKAFGNHYGIYRETMRPLLALTNGVPLLVELAAKWIREKGNIKDIGEAALLGGRIERIIYSLGDSFPKEKDFLFALCIATLAGAEGKAPRGDIEAYFPSLVGRDLSAIYPDTSIVTDRWIPSVTPQLIGDAFLSNVFENTTHDQRAKIVGAAWRINPSSMVRAVIRLGRFPDRSQFQGINAEPPDDANLNSLEVAIAFAESAALVPNSDWALGYYDAGLAHLDLVLNRLSQLDGQAAFAFADRLLSVVDISRGTRVERPLATNKMISEALSRMANSQWFPPVDELTAFLTRWSTEPKTTFLRQDFNEASANIPLELQIHLQKVTEGAEAIAQGEIWLTAAKALRFHRKATKSFASLVDQLPPVDQMPLTRAKTWTVVSFSHALVRDEEETRVAASSVDEIAVNSSFSTPLQLLRVEVWLHVLYACRDPARAKTAVRLIDDISLPHRTDRQFESLRVQAWRMMANLLSQTGDETGSQQAAETVDVISNQFSGEYFFERQRADAWASVATVRRVGGNATGTRLAASRVDAAALAFPDNRALQCFRIDSWLEVARTYTALNDTNKVMSVSEIITSVSGPFTGVREFELRNLKFWREAIQVHCKTESLSGLIHCQAKIDAITQPFAGDREFEIQRGEALAQVANVYGKSHDGEGATSVAARLDEIGRKFKCDLDFETFRVRAWGQVAFAFRENDAAKTLAAAKMVDLIAEPFAKVWLFQLERVMSWREVAVAYSNHFDIPNTLQAVENVSDVASSYRGDQAFDFEHVLVWRYAASAASRSNDCQTSVAAAMRVDTLTAPYINDRKFQWERVVAWREATFACRKSNDLTGAQAAAARVDAIASPYSGEQDFEYERDWAFRIVAGGSERGAVLQSSSSEETIGKIVILPRTE